VQHQKECTQVRATYIQSNAVCQPRDAHAYTNSEIEYFTLFHGESFDISPNLAFASSIFFQNVNDASNTHSTWLQRITNLPLCHAPGCRKSVRHGNAQHSAARSLR
jgi:hypothetical protein